MACGLSRVLRKGQKRVPLQAVQVMMDTRKEGFTKSHLPDAMVAGIPAKEMQVGEGWALGRDGPILCGWQAIGYAELRVADIPGNTSETLNTGVPCSRICLSRTKVKIAKTNQSGIPLPTTAGCLTHLGSAHQHPPYGSSLHIPRVLPGRLPETAHCLGIPLHPAIQALNQGQRRHSARQLRLDHSPAAGTQLLHQPGPRSHRTLCPMSLRAIALHVQSSHSHPQVHEVYLPLERWSTVRA